MEAHSVSKVIFTHRGVNYQSIALWGLFFMLLIPQSGNSYEVLSSKETVEKAAESGVKYEGKSGQDEEIAKKIAGSIGLSDGTPEKIYISHSALGYQAGIFVGEELCNQLMANPLTRKKLIDLWWMFFKINVPGKEIGQSNTMLISCGGTTVATVADGKIKWEL